MESLTSSLDSFFFWLSTFAPDMTFFSFDWNIRALCAIVMASFICGAVGSQVVSNRMAFFSDALAHCAFAGFALAFLLFLAFGFGLQSQVGMDPAERVRVQQQFLNWTMVIMVCFGIAIGLLIAYVNDVTGLPSDTVIGVFFAGAIGLGAVFMRMARGGYFNIESFIFGEPAAVHASHLLFLLLLLLTTAVFLALFYNPLVLASVNPSLALSRNVPVRLCRYLFVMLLGFVVNLCLFVVGALLINALLIVPAAAAANFCRNLRQLFWCSTGFAVLCGVGGQVLAWEVSTQRFQVGTGGMIVVLTVILFIISMLVGPAWRNRAVSADPQPPEVMKTSQV